jgi:dTDP-4-amino-4,6-dideoxygalactose transaminase
MPALTAIADEAGLLIIEDFAQAHGASLDGRSAGTWGMASSFSFYPTKNLGAFGDGGLVATDDARVAERVRELRQYGWRERYVSAETGVNSRLDEIQAAILRVQLRHLDDDNARRRVIAAAYDERLKSTPIEVPRVRLGARHVYHQYVVEASNRQGLMSSLRAQQIDTAIHYPQPVHAQPAYAGRLVTTADLSATEALVERIISLPMFPGLTDIQQERVNAALGLAGVAPASL